MSERMTNNKIEKMYDRFTDDFLGKLRTDDFFAFFMNAIKSGERNVYLYEKNHGRKNRTRCYVFDFRRIRSLFASAITLANDTIFSRQSHL